MRRTKGPKLIFILAIVGLAALSLAILSPPSWGGKPVDNDNDGVNSRSDCNDNDPAIYPGALELCDGKDNQCPGDSGFGTTDEGCGPTCTDFDNDGYSAEAGCGPEVDCDDYDSTVYPDAPELCNDEIDNNCDGFTNESCTECTDFDDDEYFVEAGCGENPLDCDDSRFAVNPNALEDCNTSYDDNCDGQVNEGCSVAGEDTDGDRIPNNYEDSGFTLYDNFELWNGTNWESSSSGITIPGAVNCGAEQKCLKPNVGDLFVIFRPLPAPLPDVTHPTKINLAACNIFEFATSPTSPFTVWVLRGSSATREITSAFPKKAAVLIEDAAMTGTDGYSDPDSLQITPEGRAWVYTYQIADNVFNNCHEDCKVDGITLPNAEVQCRYFNSIVAHELWHVLGALLNPSGHTTLELRIMYPSAVFTQKGSKPGNYLIGDEFSAAGLTDPSLD